MEDPLDENIAERLDRIAAILLLAFEEPLRAARERLREEKVAAAILDATEDWIGTRELQATVAKATGVSERTVRSRLAELKERKVIMSQGQGNQMSYKSTGII